MAAHWCLSTLQRIASDLSIYEDGRRIGLDVLDARCLPSPAGAGVS